MKVDELTFVYCNCKSDQSIGGRRTKTEYYDNQVEVAKAVRDHVMNEDRHWAVHFKGKHVVSVVIDGYRWGGMKRD